MRMPDPAVRPTPKPGPLPAQRIEGDSLAQVPGPQLAQVLRAPGVPLDTSTRALIEPRFGYDFSQVRIHSRRDDAVAAHNLGAAAFTVGSDIFFNSGQYRPESAAGLGLLAHELAHVIQQQSSGQPSQVIQRALIHHRPITWKDFAANPPAKAGAEGAAVNSHFDAIPSFDPQSLVKPSAKACGKGRDRSTETTVTYTADPADFSKIQPVMDTDKSWAIARYTGDGSDYCKVEEETCKGKFKGSPSGTTLTTEQGTKISKPADCFPVCMADEVKERARLLRHEQGHFDITNVMATNARDDLKALGATLNVTKTACGEQAARDAARPDYDPKVRDELKRLLKDWSALREQTQEDYDTETTHGADESNQAAWEADINTGLTKK